MVRHACGSADLWAVSVSDNQSVWPAAGELQQLCGARRLHALSRHLRNVARHLHHGRSSAGTGQQNESDPKEFPFTIRGFRLFRTDRHHGIISHHRALLPGELRQHRAALHDPEGAVESSRQAGIAAAPMSSPAGTPPPLPRYPRPAPQLVHSYRWGGGEEASLWTHFWCHLNRGRCLLYACLLM